METKIEGNTLIIFLQNDLDHHVATQIREKADYIIRENNITKVIFDFSSVGFMDSSGIGAIMGRYRLMEAIGGKVCAYGMGNRVKKIVDMSGIDSLINICTTKEECMEV